MRIGVRSMLAAASAVAALAVAGCGEDETDGPVVGTRTLTVYSSFPLQGPSERQGRDMVDAVKLALADAGGRVGELTINYVSLDAAEAGEDGWTNDKVLDNARQAVRDANAIGYIGELDSAATALSLPLLNEAGVLQVSPSSTYVGLTRPAAGRKGEPERFYPSGVRTFGRVVPADHVQGAALVEYMRTQGVRRIHLMHDRDIYGSGLTEQIKARAEQRDMEIVGDDAIDPDAEDFEDAAESVAESGADAFFYGGSTRTAAARLFAAVATAAPSVGLYAGDGVADDSFTRALSPAAQRRMRITSPAMPLRLLPASAERFRRAFRSTFDRDPEPYAAYAYEAMNAVLVAVRAAGDRGNRRADVVDAFYRVRDRRSVLGRYSIDRNGDTSLRRYAGYRVRDGRLVYDRRFG